MDVSRESDLRPTRPGPRSCAKPPMLLRLAAKRNGQFSRSLGILRLRDGPAGMTAELDTYVLVHELVHAVGLFREVHAVRLRGALYRRGQS